MMRSSFCSFVAVASHLGVMVVNALASNFLSNASL
nr:MAG TPA: hypothetical protein [Caudoviricetes sp.]